MSTNNSCVFTETTAMEVESYTQFIGDGVNVNYIVPHDFNSLNVGAIVRDINTNMLVYPAIKIENLSSVAFSFSYAPALTSLSVTLFAGLSTKRIDGFRDSIIINVEPADTQNIVINVSGAEENISGDIIVSSAYWGQIIGNIQLQTDLWRYLSATPLTFIDVVRGLSTTPLTLSSIYVNGQILSAGVDIANFFFNNQKVTNYLGTTPITLSSVTVLGNLNTIGVLKGTTITGNTLTANNIFGNTLTANNIFGNTLNATQILSGGIDLLNIMLSTENIQSLSFNSSSNDLSITSSNTVNLSSILNPYYNTSPYFTKSTTWVNTNSANAQFVTVSANFYGDILNTNSNVLLDGGNTRNANISAGSKDFYDLNLITNNQTRFTITSSGKIFILGPILGNAANTSTAFNSSTATGSYSFAANSSISTNTYSVAFGDGTQATNFASFAEGSDTEASGYASHSEGNFSIAKGTAAHAEGSNTLATGVGSHSEGSDSGALGDYSHAEGFRSFTGELIPFTEYNATNKTFTFSSSLSSKFSFVTPGTVLRSFYNNSFYSNIIVLGRNTNTGVISATNDEIGVNLTSGYLYTNSGIGSHAEGSNTIAYGNGSHAEGFNTIASGQGSHAEGRDVLVAGTGSHGEGNVTYTLGAGSHTEGENNVNANVSSHIEGVNNKTGKITYITNYTYVNNSLSILTFSTALSNDIIYATSSLQQTYIAGRLSWGGGGPQEFYAKILGYNSTTGQLSAYNFTRRGGFTNITSADSGYVVFAAAAGSHAEGFNTNAIATGSHAEGQNTIASGTGSHAEGSNSTASGTGSHAEGEGVTSSGLGSHAEGIYAVASGFASHAEGQSTTASNAVAHAEGIYTTASGYASHAAGYGATALQNYTYAWSDGDLGTQNISTTKAGQYMIHASGGVYIHESNVGINTDEPDSPLTVNGDVKIINTVSLSSVIFSGNSLTSTLAITATDMFIEVVVNGVTKYIRLFDVV